MVVIKATINYLPFIFALPIDILGGLENHAEFNKPHLGQQLVKSGVLKFYFAEKNINLMTEIQFLNKRSFLSIFCDTAILVKIITTVGTFCFLTIK